MKFANRLEALKWMVQNPGKKVLFDGEMFGDREVLIDSQGYIIVNVLDWNTQDITNLRTESHVEPEPEMDWPKVWWNVWGYGPKKTQESILRDYHDQLLKLLDARYERRK